MCAMPLIPGGGFISRGQDVVVIDRLDKTHTEGRGGDALDLHVGEIGNVFITVILQGADVELLE